MRIKTLPPMPGNVVPSFSLVLPYPPSVNHYWTQWAQGKIVRMAVSKRGVAYRLAVQAAWLEGGRPRVEGRLAVEVDVHPPTRRVSDLDNLQKSLLDSLTHAGAWGDDGQIDELTVRRREVVRGGKVVLRVRGI